MQHGTASTRGWRPWLYASLPLFFLYGGALVIMFALAAQPEGVQPPGGPFTLTDVHPVIPLQVRLVFLWTLATGPMLAWRFFRWGWRARTWLPGSLLLAALPWALGSALLLLGWRFHVLEFLYAAGRGGPATVAAGLGEYLGAQAATAAASSLLLASLLTVLALEGSRARGSGGTSEEAASNQRWLRPLAISAALLALMSAGCAALVSFEGTTFFAGIAQQGLGGWSASTDEAAVRWAWLQSAQLASALAALLFLLRLRVLTARSGARGGEWLWAAALLCVTHVAQLIASRIVLHEFAALTGAADPGPGSTPLWELGGAADDYALKPALSLAADGLNVSGVPFARWSEGTAQVQQRLTAYWNGRALDVGGQPRAFDELVMGLEKEVTLTSLTCLAETARRAGISTLSLAVGPEQTVPERTRRALGRVAPAMGEAFGSRVSVVSFRLAEPRCRDSTAERRVVLTLGPASLPDEQELDQPATRFTWTCVELSLAANASVVDLLRFLSGPGTHSEVALGEQDLSRCSASVMP
jgi:hypothetical protein